MMEPLVSVIMPAYNAEKYISEAIESILNQDYTNWELIIIEDASVDSTSHVIASYTDNRIIKIYNECNRGISYTTNRGLDIARGKYIALIDDDDIALPQRLSLQVSYMEQNDTIDILGGKSMSINETGKIIRKGGTCRSNPKYIKAVLLLQNLDFYNGTAMIRREFIIKNNLRYRENCYGMQDYKFYIESSKVGNISSIDEYLLKYRRHSENATLQNRKLYAKEREETYARFQKESLALSGFKLDEESLILMHKVLREFDGVCGSFEELEKLYFVFNCIVKQGRDMHIDYQEELEIMLKITLGNQIRKMNIFERENL